jgi:integral membrane protein (TIGR01906 family)
MNVAVRIGTVLAVPACLLFLVAGSVAWAVNDAGLYRNGFERYNTAQRSGIQHADLVRIGRDLRTYFNTTVEPLAVRAPVYGLERDIFNAREVAHMYDVKRLVRGTYGVAIGSGVWIIAVVLLGLAIRRNQFASTAARTAIWAGSVTLAAVVGVGLATLFGFERLFLLFHQLSFANDLWILDPRTDYLLIMFPGGFWFDATMRVALTSVLGAVLLVSVGVGILAYGRWTLGRRPPPAHSSIGKEKPPSDVSGGD